VKCLWCTGPAIDLTEEDPAEVSRRSASPPGLPTPPSKRRRHKEEESQEVVDLNDPDVIEFLEQAALVWAPLIIALHDHLHQGHPLTGLLAVPP
jgi:hypothetical protein